MLAADGTYCRATTRTFAAREFRRTRQTACCTSAELDPFRRENKATVLSTRT
jgi:hypothetical protein